MADPDKIYAMNINVRSGTSSVVFARFTNTNTRDTKVFRTVDNAAKANLGNSKDFPSGFSNGDFIEVLISGLRTGSLTHVVDTSKGGFRQTITLADISTTNTPAIAI